MGLNAPILPYRCLLPNQVAMLFDTHETLATLDEWLREVFCLNCENT